MAWRRVWQRRTATLLTATSVALSAGLALLLMLVRAQGLQLLAHGPRGFDLIVGPKGSGIDLTLTTLFHLESATGTISWAFYDDLLHDPSWRGAVAQAVPLAVGDSVAGCDLIATTPALFALAGGASSGGPSGAAPAPAGMDAAAASVLAAGRMMRDGTIEAVVGSEVPRRTGLAIGDRFRPTHGTGDGIDPTEVHQRTFTIVGVLAPTGSVFDRSVFVTLAGFWSIDEHERGLHDQALVRAAAAGSARDGVAAQVAVQDGDQEPAASQVAADGTVQLALPVAERRLSMILVRSRGAFSAQSILYRVNSGDQALAVNPTLILAGLARSLLAPAQHLGAALVAVILAVATLGVLVSSYHAVQAQALELAALRALGASRRWLLTLISSEAGLCGVLGGVCGLVPAHLLMAMLQWWMGARLEGGTPWWQPGWPDLLVVVLCGVAAALAGLVPGYLAGRRSVAELLC